MSSNKKTVVKRINKTIIDEAEKSGLDFEEYFYKLKNQAEDRQLKIVEKEYEKLKELPAIIDALIEQRKIDRRYIDEIEREHRKDRESYSALTKAVSNLTDLFTKALTRRG